MRYFFILFAFVLTSLQSCTSGESSQEQSSQYQESSNSPQAESVPIEKHEEVEVQEESDVEIEDDITEDDNEPYIVDTELPQTSSERMAELMRDTDYIRGSGKLKREKLARQLNREGFRKSDDSKFRRRDIPKYP